MKKIRVMHIAEAGDGIDRYLYTLLKKTKTSLEVEHVLVMSDFPEPRKFRNLAIAVETVPGLRKRSDWKTNFSSVFAIRKFIRKYKPDVVYCHGYKAGILGRTADIGFLNKTVYSPHGWIFDEEGLAKGKIKAGIRRERFFASMTNKIVCVSTRERDKALINDICREDRIEVIREGMDFCQFRNFEPMTREEFGIPENAFVIGNVNTFTRDGAADIFVDMAKKLYKRMTKVFFVLSGYGPEYDSIKEKVKEEHLEECFLMTGQEYSPMDCIAQFDIAVMTSRKEEQVFTLQEYMLSGKPIVAPSIRTIPETVGGAGMTVAPENPDALAECIVYLYGNRKVTSYMAEMGKEQVQKYNAARMAAEFLILMRRLKNR